MSKAVPVLYLDLDGTVRKGYDELGRFVNKVEDVEVFPEAIQQMSLFGGEGWRIVAITNQGGVAMGFMDNETAFDIQYETNKQTGNRFDYMMMCTHHPEASDPEMAVCWCRKPKPGMIIEAAINMGKRFNEYYPPHMALVVGDRDEDRQAAEAAGIRFIDAATWRAGGAL